MRTMKNFAAAALVMLLCTVVFGAMFTSCTNSEDGMPTFTASQKTIKVPVEVRDTIWYPVHDTLTIEVIKKEGIKANGQPGLDKIDDKGYLTWYPLIEDGNEINPSTELNVQASIADCDHDIIVLTDSIIGVPSFSVNRATRSYQDGDFTKMEFSAGWVYNFGTFSETINTVHEKAWYKGWEMLSSYWLGGLKEIKYSKGEAYNHEGIDGKLFTNTLVWEYVYNEEDVRTFTKTHKFFVANNTIEPDPEATEMFGKNFTFKTTSDNTAETAFEMWQKLNNGKEEKLSDVSATLRFWLVNAEGVIVDLKDDEAFALTDLEPVAGSKEKVGDPRLVGSISIQEYVTTYTTKTDKSSSVFYAHTEEATYIVPQGMGENIQFLSKDFSFRDSGTTELFGREYEYESYTDETGKDFEFFFSGGVLERYRTYDESVSDTIVNTVEISSDISNAMFEIPDDYTVTDTR